MATWWRGLQQISRASIVLLALVLLFTAGLLLAGRDAPSVGIVAGVVLAAAVLVVYSEYVADRRG